MFLLNSLVSRFFSIGIAAKAHPFVALVIGAAIAGAGYWGYNSYTSTDGETQYVFASVERGELVVTVSGSGQVSAENQIELAAKASGDVTSIPVKNGQTVKAGTLLIQIDARKAQKAVRDAEVNLESAKLALKKLTQPATALSTTQAKNALTDAENALAQAHDDGFNEVSDTFLALPAIMTGLDDILNGNTVSSSQDNVFAYADMIDDIDPKVTMFRDDAVKKYKNARTEYDTLLATYKAASRFSDTATIEALILETYDMTKTVAEAAKSTSDFLNLINDSLVLRDRTVPSVLTTHRSSLSTYIGDTNAQLVALLSIKDTITSSKQSIGEKTEALRDLADGADPLDVASEQLTLKQRENALQDARENLADYSVRAPFDGTVAKLNVKRADSVSSGTAVVTFITAQQIAEISLNEIDAANVEVGQKVSLTFDAVEGLQIEGAVVELDTVGTASSGVVTYTATIGFETDPRIKPGMTVNADISSDSVQEVLIVPAGAVKTDRNGSYVEVADGAVPGRTLTSSEITPRRVNVETGLSNDTHTEITNGLDEGMIVVVRTVNGGSETTQQAPNIFQATGAKGPGGGSGTVRFQSR